MDHKGESRGEYLFITLLNLALISLTNAQSVSCPVITVNDLGSTTALSTEGLIALAMVPPGEASGTRVPVRINDFTIVCDASGDRRDTSSFVSVVVELRCMSGIAGLTDVCDGNTDITRQYQFQCDEDNGGQAVWGTTVSGSALFVETENPTATLSTSLANQCRRCIDDRQQPGRPEINDVTHCDPCPSACNEGQGRCYIGPVTDMCCNFYLQGDCTDNCPSNLVADSDFNCVCPELSLVNGDVSYSHESSSVLRDVGSVATHTCESGYRLIIEGTNTTAQPNTRMCNSTNGWIGQSFACQRIKCPALSIMNGVVGSSPPDWVLNSTSVYTCDVSHVLKGDGNRVCRMNSTWSGTDPECTDCSAALTDPNCQECGFDSSGLPVCAVCRSGYAPSVDGQCEKQVAGSGVSSHSLGGILLTITIMVLCAILE